MHGHLLRHPSVHLVRPLLIAAVGESPAVTPPPPRKPQSLHSKDLLEVIRRNRREQKLQQRAGQGEGTEPLLLALDGSIRSLLQAWFSVGFLELRRITYGGSSGELLEKIARYRQQS